MNLVIRELLSADIENLREEQKFLSADLSNIQMRWHALREEKLKASSILHKVKKAEEDLLLLAEEKEQLALDEKVIYNCFHFFPLLVLYSSLDFSA